MVDDVHIPNHPGYVSVKEAAHLLGVSQVSVYRYVRDGRLPAQRIGHMLIIPVEEVRQLQTSRASHRLPSAPKWLAAIRSDTLLITDIHVQVRMGKSALLIKKLKAIQKARDHTFPGTVARYVVKGNAELTDVQILLIWKNVSTASVCDQYLRAFQDELADLLVWETAQYSTNEVMIHT